MDCDCGIVKDERGGQLGGGLLAREGSLSSMDPKESRPPAMSGSLSPMDEPRTPDTASLTCARGLVCGTRRLQMQLLVATAACDSD